MESVDQALEKKRTVPEQTELNHHSKKSKRNSKTKKSLKASHNHLTSETDSSVGFFKRSSSKGISINIIV